MRYLINILFFACYFCMYAHGRETEFDGLYKDYRDKPMTELNRLGAELLSRDSKDSALAVYTIMSNRYDNDPRPEDRDYAIAARNGLGVLSFLSENYTAAYSHFLTAVEMDGRPDAAGNLNLSAIFLYYGDHKRAYELLRRVFDEAVTRGHHNMVSASLINMLTSDIDQTVVPSDTIVKLIRIYNRVVPESPDNQEWRLTLHLSRARLLELKGNYKGALREYRQSLSSASGMLIPPRNEYASFIGMGNVFGLAGMADSAVYYYKKAESLARQHGFTELMIDAYAHMSRQYALMGDQTMADKYRYKKFELSDSVFNMHQFGKIRDLEMFHEADRFEKRIGVLQMEEKIRTRTLWMVSAGMLLFMALCGYIFAQNRSLHRKNRILYESNIAAIRVEDEKAAAQKLQSVSDVIMTEASLPTEEQVNEPVSGQSEVTRYTGSSLDHERGAELENKILRVMSDETVFCREGFSLKNLADLCGSNSKYVSQVLNDRMHTTFAQLLNERRVLVARRRFADLEHYGHLTIEAIVAELGFRSRSTFSKTFKRLTGLSPSEFQRMAREDTTQNTTNDSDTTK